MSQERTERTRFRDDPVQNLCFSLFGRWDLDYSDCFWLFWTQIIVLDSWQHVIRDTSSSLL